MTLDIITPDRTIFSGEVDSVILPGSDGSFQLLNNHAPIVASLKAGEIRIQTKEGEQKFEIKTGILECADNKVVVLA